MNNIFRNRKRPRFRNRPGPADHLELVATPGAAPTTYCVMAYGPDSMVEKKSPSLDEVVRLQSTFPVVWLDVAGFADINMIKKIGEHFAIHPLILEDIIRTHQRAKLEDYEDALFIVTRMAPVEDQEDTEQLGMYLTSNCLITFQEFPGDDLQGVRNRIQTKRGRIRSEGADYLTYAIIDAVLDAYFPLVESYGEAIEELEDLLVLTPNRNMLGEIYGIRRKLLELRRALWPHRELLGSLYRGESSLIKQSTLVYFRDCYDHTVQLNDLMDNYRELSSNLMEVYLSSVSNRLNEVMKVLTIISAIFIPLTFIAGVYGMNFSPEASPWNMPELLSYYGYPICLAVMLVIVAAQVYFFWKKGWLTSRDDAGERQSKPLPEHPRQQTGVKARSRARVQ
jgi:magnesium transporter